jgi:hypothetical protein
VLPTFPVQLRTFDGLTIGPDDAAERSGLIAI